MTSEQLKEWKEIVQKRAQGWSWGGEHWEKEYKDKPWKNNESAPSLMLIATLENAYQTAKLNELLESKAVQVILSSPNDGRLFKDEP